MSSSSQSADPFKEGWIEEGLYYRGKNPPKSREWSDDDWVYMPHENYIPISKSRIIKAMSDRLTGKMSDEQLTPFVALLEGVYHFHYHKTLNALKEDYEYFSPSLGEQIRVGISTEELELRERNFLVNFIQLMIRGNFNPLGEAEHQQAEQHSYLLDLPIDVNWSIKDPTMYKKLFAYSQTEAGQDEIENRLGVNHLERYLDLPQDYEQRIMIFHRGISPDRTEGLFFMQKINQVIDKIFGLILKPLQKSVKTVSERTEHLVEGTLERGKGLLAGKPFAPRNLRTDEVSSESSEEAIGSGVVFLPRWLRRTSLSNQPFSLGRLFKSSLLQEPAIERVICVFRQYPPSPPPLIRKLPLIGRFLKIPKPNETDPTIHVKLFQDIPLADLEIIFPEKHIRMKSFDKFMLGFLGFIGLVLGLMKGLGSGKGTLAVIFTVLGLLAFKTITRFINTRRRYMLQMSQDLYRKNLDNDLGVLQYLVDNIEDQEFKESFIAYMLLVEAGRPLTEAELDDAAERFINEAFNGLEVDFEVDDALEKITVQLDANGQEQPTQEQLSSTMFLPLVQEVIGDDGETRYQAKPVADALEAMDYRWDNFFQYA
jgi:hypothetical protein